jgi:hypothetical protein
LESFNGADPDEDDIESDLDVETMSETNQD